MTEANFWQMGLNGVLNLAQGGAFGSTVASYTGRVVNPPNVIASPAPAPPPAPIVGQQAVNPPAEEAGHFAQHWPKYAIAGGVLLLVIIGVSIARK